MLAFTRRAVLDAALGRRLRRWRWPASSASTSSPRSASTLTTGNAGLISLSHGAFLGVGCYTVAWLGKHGVPFYATLPVGGAS